jgi:glycosyltransferase involved in cell wall biosynthesis
MDKPMITKEDQPLVSIIVPCYNHEKYIAECVISIFNQTYQNFELIIIDDGSNDNSFEVLTKLQKECKFTLIHQENKGIAVTLNRAIKEFSRGKYITFCASDDFWELSKLEKQVNFMERNSQYPMCYGRTYYVDTDSNIIKRTDNNLKSGWLFEEIFTFRIHPPVNYLFRAEIFKEVGYYDESILAEDYYMNLKISSKYPIGYLNEYLCYYRIDFNPKKVERIKAVLDSQLKVIEEYKGHRLYKKAKRQLFLNKFDWLSGFKQSKSLALKSSIFAAPMFFNKRYWVALAKLFVCWK